MRDSFIFYKSFYDAIQDLDEKNQLALYNAICQKSLYDEDVELTGIADTLYKLIKPQLDANNERYENGKKGGRPKTKTIGFEKEKTTGFENKKPNKNNNVNVNDNVNVNVNDNDIYIPVSENDVSKTSVKANKQKYGKYKNVLLKDEELQSLKNEYENWEELINYLDEYIERKGYKAKSHYLCVKKWVINAVKEENQKKEKNKTNFTQRNYSNLNSLYSNLGGNK